MELTEEKKKELKLKIIDAAKIHGFEVSEFQNSMYCERMAPNSPVEIARFMFSVNSYSYVFVKNIAIYSIAKRKLVKYSVSSLKKKHGYVDDFSVDNRLCYDAETFNLDRVLGSFFKKVDQITDELKLEERRVARAKKLTEIRDSEISYKLDEVKSKLQETFPGMMAEVKTAQAGNLYKITLYNYVGPGYGDRKYIALSQAEYEEYGVLNKSFWLFGSGSVYNRDLPDTGETPLYTLHKSIWGGSERAPVESLGEWGFSVQYAGEDNWRLFLLHGKLPFDETKIVKSTEIMSWVEWVIGVEKKFYAAFKEYRRASRAITLESVSQNASDGAEA